MGSRSGRGRNRGEGWRGMVGNGAKFALLAGQCRPRRMFRTRDRWRLREVVQGGVGQRPFRQAGNESRMRARPAPAQPEATYPLDPAGAAPLRTPYRSVGVDAPGRCEWAALSAVEAAPRCRAAFACVPLSTQMPGLDRSYPHVRVRRWPSPATSGETPIRAQRRITLARSLPSARSFRAHHDSARRPPSGTRLPSPGHFRGPSP